MNKLNIALSMALSASLFATTAVAQNLEQVELIFSVTSDDHPSEVRKRYREFHRILEEEINKRLTDKQARVLLAIAPSYEVGIEQMVSGEAHFARLTPVAYVNVKLGSPEAELLAQEIVVDEKDDPTNYGLIVVKDDSPVQSLEDLKGKTIAFADTYGSAGRYHAQEYLEAGGVSATDFAGYSYLGRFDKVAEAVEAGEFDAGAINEHTFDDEVESGMPLRMVGELFPVPFNAWVASTSMPEDLRAALKASLLEMSDPDMLAAGNIEGFIEADDSAYESTRHAMENHGDDYPPQE